jgi:acetylornithine deacetylase
MTTALQKTDAYIEQHGNEIIRLLQKMVQQPSTQGNEHGVQQIVIQKLETLGLKPDIWDPAHTDLEKSSYFIPSRPSYLGSPNVVGVLKGTGGGKSIILNGHIDVVPEGDRSKWSNDPFSGEISGGKMFGRGTTDMKGGNVALILAMEAVIRSGITLKGDVIFQSVIEEESGGTGTLATVLRGYRADAAIIPEPTKMKLFIKQQGSMWFRITVEGRSAHAGTRYEGVSAIEQAWKIHDAILNLERVRNEKIDDLLYEGIPIPLPINVGKIQGGSWPSSVPDLVMIEGRIGVGPHEKIDDVKSLLRQTVATRCAGDAWLKDHPAKVDFFGGLWLPNAVDQDHPFVKLVSEDYSAVYGKPIKIEASPWGTDAGILGSVGKIPALVIGPGETRVAHYPDEFIVIEEILTAARLFARILIDWCVVNSIK